MGSRVTVEGKALRFTFIRRLIAEGDYETSIIAKCQASPLFERVLSPRECATDNKQRRVRPIGRRMVSLYLRQVRRRLFDTDFDPGEEIRLAYERMVRAFQMSVADENVGGMVKAQREISRLFGFGQKDSVGPSNVDMDKVRDQCCGMDLSIGGLANSG